MVGWEMIHLMCFFISLFVTRAERSLSRKEVILRVDTSKTIHVQSMDHSYICATLDWWPNNKCDSVDGESNCAWINASVLNAPITPGSRLQKAATALGKFTLRLGGTLADSIVYDVGEDGVECPNFSPSPPNKAKLFTGGCLRSSRWEEILQFCPNKKPSQCEMIFGINGMSNRTCVNVDPSRAPCFYPEATCSNTFDFSNAERLIRATAEKGYSMKGYEFGNELTCLSPQQYAESLKQLNTLIQRVTKEYEDVLGDGVMPFIAATDSKDPDPEFFSEFVPLVDNILYAASWHSYPLNAGVYCTGPNAVNNSAVDDIIMNPNGMDTFITDASEMSRAIKKTPWVETWMGETGGAFDSGCRGSTNTFMSGFWYLNSLGAFAANGHDMFCRQTFTGGNYELVNKVTNVPNPDYYSTLLFGKLMGNKVLDADAITAKYNLPSDVRVYAHCSTEDYFDKETNISTQVGSVSLLYLNYNKDSVVMNDDILIGDDHTATNRAVRLEFILTGVYNPVAEAIDALHSDLVALNGKLLIPDIRTGDIPALYPRVIEQSCITADDCSEPQPLILPGYSYGYFVYPYAGAVACL